jgi:hypothetical protein
MSHFKYVETLRGYAGIAKVYSAVDGSAIMISRANTFDRGDETMIFPYDLFEHKVLDWDELYSGYGEDHATALARYEASL